MRPSTSKNIVASVSANRVENHKFDYTCLTVKIGARHVGRNLNKEKCFEYPSETLIF